MGLGPLGEQPKINSMENAGQTGPAAQAGPALDARLKQVAEIKKSGDPEAIKQAALDQILAAIDGLSSHG